MNSGLAEEKLVREGVVSGAIVLTRMPS